MSDGSKESNHSSDCTCVFQKAFIEALEQLPQLWDPTDINFKNKRKRAEGLESLLALQRKSNANATRDLVRRKVHWLISNYRRTLKQLESAKENGDEFKPKWQFKALQFLHKRESLKDNSQLCDEILIKNDPHNYESDEHINYETFACTCDTRKIFIEALKKLPELWDPTHVHYKNKVKRNVALDTLLAVERNSNPQASKDLVRRKAYWLISNYRRSLKQVETARRRGEVYRPQWQFKALHFLQKRERIKENHYVGEHEGCAASRMWRSACSALAAPHSERAWGDVSAASPPDSVWHSLRNCVAYQAGVWQSLLLKGVEDVAQPAAFKLAMVLRHTPSELTVRLLADLLRSHPQSQDLTSYILALLTDDSPWCGSCREAEGDGDEDEDEDEDEDGDLEEDDDGEVDGDGEGEGDGEGDGDGDGDGEGEGEGEGDNAEEEANEGAPLRDLQLFGDCELAVLAASRVEYDAHAKRQRAEYCAITQRHYVELRIKMLNQLIQAPKVYQTPEFACFEEAARENVEREICTLREHLLTGRHD